MRPIRLDALTVDRLLSGEVSSDDAPPGYAGVARLLDAAGSEVGAEQSIPSAATLAAMRAATLEHGAPVSTRQRRMTWSKVFTVKAAAAAAVLLGASSAAAATGALPAGIQNTASTVLAKIGISVPRSNNANSHAATPGKSPHSAAGKGPSANATHGLCTAEEAHADSGHEPNTHATVFPPTTTCNSVPHLGQQNTGAPSENGTSPSPSPSPNANATYGLCTAQEAHADSGHQPNTHATVFPPTTTCNSVPHPGQAHGNASITEGTSSTTTEGHSGPPSSMPERPTSPGRSHDRP